MTLAKNSQPTLWEYETFLNLHYKTEDKEKVYDKFLYLTNSSREKPMRIDRFEIAVRTNTIGTTLRKYDFESFQESFEKDKIAFIKPLV